MGFRVEALDIAIRRRKPDLPVRLVDTAVVVSHAHGDAIRGHLEETAAYLVQRLRRRLVVVGGGLRQVFAVPRGQQLALGCHMFPASQLRMSSSRSASVKAGGFAVM